MFLFTFLVLTQLVTTGCTSVRVTDPVRTATEQFLLSAAAERAVTKLSVSALRGRLIYVDGAFFAGVEREYVMGQLRAHLVKNGARLTNDKSQAEAIVELRSGGVGIDRYGYLLGVPPILVPDQATGGGLAGEAAVISPELAIVKNIRQYGVASVAIIAYWADTGELVAASGPAVGYSYREDWWFFGIGPRTTGDIAPIDAPEAATARARELRAELEAEAIRREQAIQDGDDEDEDADAPGPVPPAPADSRSRLDQPSASDPDSPEE